jgi:glucosamine--fructose-6-phosphate aminotransferase (isomerizing)
MCGIIGYLGQADAAPFLLDGLSILENRGYDSAGLATLSPAHQIVTTKFAGRGTETDAIARLREKAGAHLGHTIGIAHTRWATHGGKTDANAHPHHDAKNRIALVHNGVIENSSQLRAELQGQGIEFRSQTDTEVIAQLIGAKLDHGQSLIDAVKATLAQLEGTWGLAIIATDQPEQIIAARNGSPILIGVGQGEMFIASEAAAFSEHTKQYIALENGEMAVIKIDGANLDLSRVEQASDEVIHLTPEPYPHWTIKEINEQPEAVQRAMNYGARLEDDVRVKLGGLEQQKEVLATIRHLIIAACGTSFHAGLYGAQIMRALKSFDSVQVVDASEFTSEMIPPTGGGLLVISQSGETKDVHRCISTATKAGIPVFSIVNAVGSLIARSTKCGVYLNAGREHAVASTKAFTTQVTVLTLVANWFAQLHNQEEQKRRRLIEALRRLPSSIQAVLNTRSECQQISAKLVGAEHCFLLGKGLSEPIAREGALKIKEITYIHAEGYPGGALKHGPFALITPGTPIILSILDDVHAPLMRTAAEEVRARGAITIILTDNLKLAEGVADETIVIPHNHPLTALISVIPLQILAYEIAVLKGLNPDKPRNLAKAVTVD